MEKEAANIFNISNEQEFNNACLSIFKKQSQEIEVYGAFVSNLGVKPEEMLHYTQIPFLPIAFFKNHKIMAHHALAEAIFTSSGTTGMQTSQHFVKEVDLYEKSYLKGFEKFYGQVNETCFLALLPNYLEREGSSLIYMVKDLIEKSNHPNSGFFLYNHQELFETLLSLKQANQKTVLIGVTYALLDFIEKYSLNFPNLVVMETGGMKGKRKEMIREELHQVLCNGFGIEHIHSEYGMTELLSQAYSLGDGIFNCVPWMKVLIRDTNDPLSLLEGEKTGGINVIDLANFNSCSFIATQDLGKIYPNGSFEVLGRFDQSDVRGCNLMVE